MRKALTGFINSLPDRVKGTLSNTEVDVDIVVMHSYAVKKLLTAGTNNEDPTATVLGRDVELVKRRLRGAVVSEIDKEREEYYL